MITLTIKGTPSSWSAHQGFGSHAYNPKIVERQAVQWQIREQFKDEPIAGPVKVEYFYHMPIPKNASKVRRAEMMSGAVHHFIRPDLDNLNKFLSDAIKSLVIVDDSQICEMVASKAYSDDPRTVILIHPLTRRDDEHRIKKRTSV